MLEGAQHMKKRILSMILALSMVFSMFPAVAFASSDALNIEPNPSTGQIYFGKKENGHDPALYRVMAKDEDTITLFFDGDNIATNLTPYDTVSHADWSGSRICQWLNDDSFLNNSSVFTTGEKEAIADNYGSTETVGLSQIDISQKIVLPSYDEVNNGGAWGMNPSDRTSSYHWWLRSPTAPGFSSASHSACGVKPTGEIYTTLVIMGLLIRPAFKLNLSNILFTSAAIGGKSEVASSSLTALDAPSGEQKLTILDVANLDAGTVTAIGPDRNDGTTIKVSTTGATANSSLSAIITDSTGAVTYYGKIGETDALGNASNCDLTLPVSLDTDNILKIFVETINGDKLTDYASAPVPVKVSLCNGTFNMKGTDLMVNTSDATTISYGGTDWRVIGANGMVGVATEGGNITLLAKDTLKTSVPFDADNTSNEYADSDLKTEIDQLAQLSSEGNGGLFTQAEQNAINRITLTGGSSNTAGTGMSGSDVSDAILWPLDVAEANLVNMDIRKTNLINSSWWLRSPSFTDTIPTFVLNNGNVCVFNNVYLYELRDVRPAVKINLDFILFASAATGGKTTTASNRLTAMSTPTDTQKLTIIDDANLDAGTVIAKGADTNDGTAIKVSTTGATASKSLSAIIANSTDDTIEYYGKIADIDGNGTVTNAKVTLPISLDTDHVLYIIAEELNGDNLTDYASTPQQVTVSVNDAEKVAAAKEAIETALSALSVSNTTIDSDILTAATQATLYGVNVAWNTTNGFHMINATSSVPGSITGTLDLTLGIESDTLAVNKTIAKLPHIGGGGSSYLSYMINVTQTNGGTISPSTTSIREQTDNTYSITPKKGYVISDVLVDGKSIGAVSSYTFKNVTSNHSIKALFQQKNTQDENQEKSNQEKNQENPNTEAWNNPFVDVKESDWFYKSVGIAFENDIMKGMSDSTFEPNTLTSRAMIITILYNMAGKPESAADDSTWYAKSRAWAMATNISDGADMQGYVTREQLATMLWRNAGDLRCRLLNPLRNSRMNHKSLIMLNQPSYGPSKEV